MAAPLRKKTDEVFGRMIPTDDTLEYVQRYESTGYYLIATRSGQNREALDLHRILENNTGVHHYQQSAILDGEMIPINLYFVRHTPRKA